MMSRRISRPFSAVSVAFIAIIAAMPLAVYGNSAIGPRVGINLDSDKFIVGAEAEIGSVFESFRFAPSLDFELGDNTTSAFNSDFRLYLFNLPETGLRFYGSVGPTVIFDSPEEGESQTEVGLSLVAGLKIPMKGHSRYQLEARFGFGEVPDLKVMFGVLFGI